MLHKAWSSIEKVPYLFFKVIRQISRSHGSKNHRIWPKLGVSRLLLQFEFTNGYEMKHNAWSSIEEMPYCFWGSSVKFLGHTAKKIVNFDPNWAFPDCNSNFNSPMGMKWCIKLEVAYKRCPIVLRGHPSNFKVAQLLKLSNLTQIGRFRPATPVWIHWWLWNDAQSLKQHRRGALLFLKGIRQISRSQETKNCRFWPKLSVSGL